MSYLQDLSKHYFKFIHIGKCGGTYVNKVLNIDEYHDYERKGIIKGKYKKNIVGLNYQDSDFFIIWLRNPIRRFVSAFWYAYDVVSQDINEFENGNISTKNSLAPWNSYLKFTKGFAFSREYDKLIVSFNNPNELAESLNSPNITTRKRAHKLMNHPEQHINNSIGWYLQNGNFIKKYKNKIVFVGCLENIDNDLNKLGDILNTKFKKISAQRNNMKNYSKFLSPLAIKNIKEFYKNTDYKTLKVLLEEGFITKDTYDSYQTYN